MFTGIVETLGTIKELRKDNDNLHISIRSSLTPELKVDQSVSHNGVCLTVVSLNEDSYTVTAIREAVERTNRGNWKEGDIVNLERGMKLGDRLDGHIVQGHVDQIGTSKSVASANGSGYYTFEYDKSLINITIENGS